MSRLRLRNTRTGKTEEFRPAGSPVTMYVCGPTVYGSPHIGNARPVVVFDVLYRLLRYEYGEVSYVRNITDIDDKIIAASAKEGLSSSEIAKKYAAVFQTVAQTLGNLPPTLEPRATDHVDEMIKLTQILLEKGNAYAAKGHVLFSVASFEDYGKLSNRCRDEMVAGARIEIAPYKKDPADFVLWKPSPEDEPGWNSPWGRGRPGWHLECSAMINDCLGGAIDIHAGGGDLVFPHHENEIAQSCCAFELPVLAQYWLHNGAVTQNGSKMAKSTGNLVRLDEVLEKHHGEVIRYALLSTHYRSPMEWGEDTLVGAKNSLTRLYRTLEGADLSVECEPDDEFLDALRNDLNTPQAFARLHELASQVNRSADGEAGQASAKLMASCNWLGFLNESPHDWLRRSKGGDVVSSEWVEELIEQRRVARSGGNFAEADRLRSELAEAGIRLEDSAEETSWSRL